MSTTTPPTAEQSPIPATDAKAVIVAAVDAAKPRVAIVPTHVTSMPEETEADRVKRAVADALAAERTRTAEAAQKAKEEAELAAAKEQGKWKEIAEKAEAKAAELDRHNRALKRSTMLSEHLAADHPDYVNRAKYILPLIPADADGDVLVEAVKKAAADFVKDNPTQTKGTGAPAPLKPQRAAVGSYPQLNGTEMNRPRFSSTTWNG